MRLIPRTIAGRTILTLAAGMFLLLTVAAALSVSDLFDDEPRPRGPAIAGRMAMAARVVARVPAELREATAETFAGPDLAVRWLAQPRETATLRPDPDGERLERRLRRAVQSASVSQVAVGRGPDDVTVARISFPDGSGVEFRGEIGWRRSLLRLLVPLVLVGAGLIALSVWAARLVTAPLRRFAVAAERIGASVDVAPLAEDGPDEVRRAAQAFNRMQQRIRRFIEERLHVLAAASHDLRTPITRLRLRAEFVDDEELRGKMLKDLADMEAIIASTIAYVREETVSEPSERVALSSLMEELCADLCHAGHEVSLAHAAAATVHGRPTALKRAFINLIENAALYGGRASVRLDVADDRALVTIDDDGPGIPEAEQEKVFAPFYRLERSRNRETGGSGLGLSVALRVVSAHAGTIVLSNRAEGGLRQLVSLPLDRCDNA